MKRAKFNENWKVWKDNDPFELVFRVPADAVTVDLPYDAMFHEEQKAGAVNGGSTGNIDAGEYKYLKTFFVPEEAKGGRMMLQFEGVYRNALVFVNQSKVGESAYGYTDYMMDISDYVRYGQENTVMVAVKCGTRSSRWYSGAGIYRDVYLMSCGPLYVKPYDLRMTTLNADADGALVEVKAQIHNESISAATLNVRVKIQDKESVIADNCYKVRMNSRSDLEFRKNIYIDQAKLWDEDHPDLYKVTLTIDEDGKLLDETEIVSGIRILSVDSRHGLRVNGKTVKLRGACLHHDQGILGAATYADYEYRRIKRLKEAGFNAVRSAHNPASQALLNACDALGVYVMDELVDVWNKSKVSYDYSIDFMRNWESDIEHMVADVYNHPSVVLYSTGNEIFEICTDKGIETSRMLTDKFHAMDPTRFVTNGINGAFAAGDGLEQIVKDITHGQADTGSGDVNVFMSVMATSMPEIVCHPILSDILEKLETTMDVMGYNYMTSRYLKDAEAYKDRVMVGSETYPKQIAENWDVITSCPAAIGDFTWTGWDYLGEVSPVYPDLMNTGGDISVIGSRRPTSYYREIVYGLTKQPCIAVQDPARFGTPRFFGPWCFTDCTFNYTYPGMEGKPIMIQIYAGGDRVELFQNGKSLGVQPCGKETDFETQFNVTYEPGVLEAVAYENGVEIGRTILTSVGEPAKVGLDAEVYSELAFINVDVQDAQGALCAGSNADLELLSLEGPAKLLAFGGVNARHDHGYEKVNTTAGDGHALLILKRTGEGSVKVQIGGEGLVSAEITF